MLENNYQSYNPIEIRYASGELAKGNFVQEKDLIAALEEISSLQESIEILRVERSYWHTMYNQERHKMCCDGWELSVEEDEETGYCPDCGSSVVFLKGKDPSDCNAIFGCNYSPCICDRCGARPCDQSC